MKTYAFTILSILWGCSAIAQGDTCACTLKGIVIDSTEHTALEMTLISAEGRPGKQDRTDRKGYFEISGLCKGKTEFHVSHLNCEHIHFILNIQRDTFITIYLKHSVQELEGYKVTHAHGRQQGFALSSGKNLETGKIKSLGSMLQEIPGISLLKSGNNVSKPLVNGLYGNRVIIANNGIRQEGQNWGMEHAPEIDAFLASEIELLKGAEALRYGSDGIGGVILIKPRSVFAEKKSVLGGNLYLGGNSNGRGGTLSAHLGTALDTRIPVYLRIQGTGRTGGNTKTSQDILANTGLRENNFSISAGVRNPHIQTELFFSSFRFTQGIFTGSQTGNLSDLQTAINSSRPLVRAGFTYDISRPYQYVSHQLLKSKTEIPLNAKNKLEFNFSVQNNKRREFDMLRSATAFNGPNFDYYIRTGIAEALWTRSDFHGLNYKIGLLYLRQSNAYTGRYFIPGFYQNSFAQYLITSGKINKKTGFEASMRSDVKTYDIFVWKNNSLDRKRTVYPGLTYAAGLNYTGLRKNRFSLLHTSAWRPPAPNELYSDGLHQGLASIEKGDTGLLPERSYQFSFNHTFSSGRITAEYELFYQYIYNFINLIPASYTQLSIRGAYPVFLYTRSNAVLNGINLRIKATISKRVYVMAQGNAVSGTDADRQTPISMIPPFSGKITAAYEHKKLNLQLWSQFTARQYRYTEGSDFKAPPPAYYVAGLDLQYAFSLKGREIKCQLSASNLTNQSYRDYMNRFRYFAEEQGFNLFFRMTIPLDINLKPIKKPIQK